MPYSHDAVMETIMVPIPTSQSWEPLTRKITTVRKWLMRLNWRKFRFEVSMKSKTTKHGDD